MDVRVFLKNTTFIIMDKKTKAYLDFLRFSLHDGAELPASICDIDWDGLFKFGTSQCIRGVLFGGIKKLKSSDPHPTAKQLNLWLTYVSIIKKSNVQVYRDADFITRAFKKDTGFDTVVMKGQANALLYPSPYIREPGDIDLWTTASTKQVIRWARCRDQKAIIGYHHIDVSGLRTPVEVHYIPSFMGNLFYEWRLRRYFGKEKAKQFDNKKVLPDDLGEIGVLSPDFDSIFQLSHMMHHFFFEGLGFRQVIDFYYLLRSMPTIDKGIMAKVKRLNMRKFTAAMMFIMHDILGLEQEKLLCEPNPKIGMMMLEEMLKAGNFGFYDERYDFSNLPLWRQYLLETYRNLHFAKTFPSETVFGRPLSRFWHAAYKFWLSSTVD